MSVPRNKVRLTSPRIAPCSAVQVIPGFVCLCLDRRARDAGSAPSRFLRVINTLFSPRFSDFWVNRRQFRDDIFISCQCAHHQDRGCEIIWIRTSGEWWRETIAFLWEPAGRSVVSETVEFVLESSPSYDYLSHRHKACRSFII